MISHELIKDKGILIVTPGGRLESDDFKKLAEEIDPYIKERGRLNGLMIHVKSFPGWDNFGAMISHFKFVRDHHQQITKVAAVTDSKFLSIMPRVVDHFVNAEVKHFDHRHKQAALKWLQS
ncbi:MAG: STAS/SEC14 domain-containing protein [Acidiferrobacterales bacterium]